MQSVGGCARPAGLGRPLTRVLGRNPRLLLADRSDAADSTSTRQESARRPRPAASARRSLILTSPNRRASLRAGHSIDHASLSGSHTSRKGSPFGFPLKGNSGRDVDGAPRPTDWRVHALRRASYSTFRYADDTEAAGEAEEGEEERGRSRSGSTVIPPPGGSGSTEDVPRRQGEASIDAAAGGAWGGACHVPIIAPFTTKKLTWDLWVGILIVYSALSVPFRIGFGVETTTTWQALDLVTDFFFFLDIVANFHTSFVHPATGAMVVSRPAIAAHYMRGWFAVDFASTFPFDLIVDLASGSASDSAALRSTRLLRILRLARLLKLMRLSRLSRLLRQLESWNGQGASQSTFSLLRLTLYLTVVAHFIACFWYGVSSDTPPDSAMISWVVGAGLDRNSSLGHNYTVSLYWAFTSMTTVGYGDITPGTDRERVFTVIALLVGASAFGYIVGSVFLMLEQIDAVRAEFVDKMDRLNDYVRYRELPDVLASRLRRHTKHFYSSHTVFDEDSVLNALPRVLRARLLVHSRARMLRSFRLLRTRQEWEPLFLADIARRMLPQFVSEGESLFEEGDLPQYLTILLSGEVELCVTCRHPEHLPASIRAKVCERCPPGAEEPDAAGTPDEGGERGYATEEKEPRANATPDTTGGGGDAGRGVVPMSRYERVEAFAMAGGVAALRCPGSGHERSHAAAVATVTAASGMKRKAWRQRRETNFLFAIRRRGESVGETSVAYHIPHDCTATATQDAESVVIPVADVNALCQMWPDFAAKLEAQAEQAQRSVNSFRVRQLQWLCKKANPGTRPANTGAGGGGAVGARRGDASHGGAAEPSATPAAPAAAAEPGAISQQEPSVGPAAGSGVSRSRRWLMQRRVPSFLRLETPVSSRALPTVQASGDAPLPAADGRGSKEDSGGSSEAAEPNQGPGEQTSQADAGNGAGGSAPENNGEEGGGDHTSARRSRLRSAAARSLRRAQSVGASFVVRGGLNGRSIASSVPGARSSLDRSYSFRNVLQTPATSRRNRCMLRPQQPSKVAWDLWVAVLIIYSTLTVPFRLAFGKSGVRIWVVLDTATDLCFFLDIVANFHTAYTDAQGALVWDKSRVAARYLRTWFLLDLVSTLPFDWLVISTAQGGADQGVALRSTKLLRVLRLARLLKLARVLKLSKIPGVHEDTVAISPAVLRLVRLLLSIAFVAHLNGCLWFGVADAGNSTSWVNACCADASTVGGHGPRCIADLHTAEQYLASVFWALTTQTTVGYGDITPSLSRPAELWVAIVSILMGTIIFAYVVGAVMELVMNSDPAGYLFKQGMRTMRDYLLEFDILPSSLCSFARKQYAHHMKRRGVYADADMLRGAPTLIRNATLRFVHRNSLLGAPLLSAMEQAHPGFLALLEVFARVRALQRGEFVQVPGESCAEAWFVLRGRLQVWRGGQCERLLEAGDVGCGPALYLPAHIPGYARVAVVARDDAHIAAVPRGFVDALDRVAPSVCDRFLEAVEALDLCARISRKARGKLEARFTDAGAQQRPHVASAPSDTPGDDGARPTLTGGIAASRREVGVAVRAAGLVATHGALATRLYRLPTPDELPALVQDMARGKGPHAEGRRTRSARSILSRAAISLRWTASVAPEVAESPKVGGEGLNSQAAEAEADSLVAVPRYQRPLDRSYSASSLDVDGVEDGNVRQMLALIDDWIAVAHEDMPDLVAHLQSLADEANASEAAALKAAREGGLKLS